MVSCVACSDGSGGEPSRPYTVQVVSLISPTEVTNPASFEIVPQTLSTLEDLNSLNGSFVRMFFGGALRAKSVLGSIVNSGYFDGGETPRLRYSVKSGVVVPSDYNTLVLLSAYYQFDLIASKVFAIYGLQPGALVDSQENRKYHVLFEPTLEIETSGVSGSVSEKRNAAFVPGHGQFVLFERSRSERVPLAANLQVISHEFGHAVFDYTFFDNAFSSESAYAGNFVISGLNEGIADFTSFLWSGSSDVLAGSLIGLSAVVERNFAKSSFVLDDAGALCTGRFYCLGTLFARSLWQVSMDLPSDAVALSQSIPSRLRSARSELDAVGIAVDSNSAEYSTLSVADFQVLKVFLKSFATANSSLTPGLTTKLCSRFAENFSLGTQSDWSCP